MADWLKEQIQKAAGQERAAQEEVAAKKAKLKEKMAAQRQALAQVHEAAWPLLKRVEQEVKQSGLGLACRFEAQKPDADAKEILEERLTVGRKSFTLGFDVARGKVNLTLQDDWSRRRWIKRFSPAGINLEKELQQFLFKALP